MTEPNQKWRVLFVCLGNICRSPSAEIIFRKLVTDAGRTNEFHIDSAGTIGNHQGEPPDARMAAALRRHGYTVTGHSRKILPSDLIDFDLIITMDASNRSDVIALARDPSLHSKIRPLTHYCTTHQASSVPDPYYGGNEGFEHVIKLLEDGCLGILKALPPNHR